MEKDHLKGAFDKAKGATKETIGKATGNDRLRAEGRADKVEGEIHNRVGDAKDAAERATKK